jgi:hypothetical protein
MEGNGKRTIDNQKVSKLRDKSSDKGVSEKIEKGEKIDKPVKWAKNKHSFVVAGISNLFKSLFFLLIIFRHDFLC